MGKSAKIEFNGKSFTFPVITGSENEEAIDINQLRSETGLITYDPGYKNTGHCISEITYLDGENGVLRYRGYSVDELCKKKSFLEVVYLLIYGDLPSKSNLQKLQADIREEALVDEDLKQIFNDLKKLFELQGYQINWNDLEKQNVRQTINTLSMASPFTLEEKQILLETKNLVDRKKKLEEILITYTNFSFTNKTIQ